MAAPGGHSQCNFLAVPIHVGALPWAAKAVYDYFGEDIHPGDVIHVRSGGGGGWGDPGERSAVARQRDLRDGFVTSPTSSDDAGDGNTTSSGTQ